MNLKKIAVTGVMAALLVGTAATGAVASETSSGSSTTCSPTARPTPGRPEPKARRAGARV